MSAAPAQTIDLIDIDDSNFGRQPVASPVARWLTIVVSLVLISISGVAIRELWLTYQDTNWVPFAPEVTNFMAHVKWQMWMLPASIAAVIVGLVLFYIALRPRTKTHQRLYDRGVSLWMRTIDIARMTSAQAMKVPGVDDARTEVTRRGQVKLVVTARTGDPTLEDRVIRTVTPVVDQVFGSPTLSVTIHTKEGEQ